MAHLNQPVMLMEIVASPSLTFFLLLTLGEMTVLQLERAAFQKEAAQRQKQKLIACQQVANIKVTTQPVSLLVALHQVLAVLMMAHAYSVCQATALI